MNKKKKTIVWLLLFIFLIVVFTSLATYAYFAAREQFYGGFDVEVTSKGVDVLTFGGSEDALIEANASNFAPGIGRDLTGSAKMEVKLETTKKETKYCYQMTMKLPNEEVFVYSEENRPELLLNVKKSTDGISYETVIENMDITTMTGDINIPVNADNKEFIHTISTVKRIDKVDYWQADVTLVWFEDVAQTINDNKSYSATLEAKRVECN